MCPEEGGQKGWVMAEKTAAEMKEKILVKFAEVFGEGEGTKAYFAP